jgi:hypothetical protein
MLHYTWSAIKMLRRSRRLRNHILCSNLYQGVHLDLARLDRVRINGEGMPARAAYLAPSRINLIDEVRDTQTCFAILGKEFAESPGFTMLAGEI